MPLKDYTRDRIYSALVANLLNYIERRRLIGAPRELQPFHNRLLPSAYTILLPDSSFSALSLSWLAEAAEAVASQFHARARYCHTFRGRIQPAATSHIETILEQMERARRRRKPCRTQDIIETIIVQSPGGTEVILTADLFVETNSGQEWYFKMETAAPTKQRCKEAKRFILRTAAARKARQGEAFAAMAYNPEGDGKDMKNKNVSQ